MTAGQPSALTQHEEVAITEDVPHRQTPGGAPVTPDGRYFVVRGRLWRCTNPALPDEERVRLTARLMRARRDVGEARKRGDRDALAAAGAAVDTAKIALGERGPVWWDDGSPDLNRHMARTTPYAAWFRAIEAGGT